MSILPRLALFATEGNTGIATSADLLVGLAMEVALPLLKALAVLIIIWGVVCAAMRLVGMEIKVLQGKQYKRDAAVIRQHLGYYLLLALEFLIAVDIIETLMHPDWKELGVLGALLVLRTLTSFSLQWEMKEVEKQQRDKPQIAGASDGSCNS